MELNIIAYRDLLDSKNQLVMQQLEQALLYQGIVGIQGVPEFEAKTRAYIHVARAFSLLDQNTKQQYAPDRDAGVTEGYELGAEWFQNQEGAWLIDDKKASYYACVPDQPHNVWPCEVDLKTPYLQLGKLIFQTGKLLLQAVGLNESMGLNHQLIDGYGRMLHYHKENDAAHPNPDWCGAHLDHGLFTGLVPAYYFYQGEEVNEPEEAGLHIVPSKGTTFEKINANDKSILLFQVGEFGQLISHDRIKATRHKVKKSAQGIERYSFALFFNPHQAMVIQSQSVLKEDSRYLRQQAPDGRITYEQWAKESYDRYRAKAIPA